MLPAHEKPAPDLGSTTARTTKAFWQSVRFFIETIWALFGGPEVIADMRNLSRAEHALLASWLRKAEALVRKILVIEARDIQIEEKKYKACKAKKRAPMLREFYADEPQTWRVTFRIAERDTQGTRTFCHAKGYVSPTARFPEAWPLAERFEALLRVFDAPEAYTKRSARLMRRLPQKLKALCAVPVFEGFEEVFEPLRPPLCAVCAARLAGDTS